MQYMYENSAVFKYVLLIGFTVFCVTGCVSRYTEGPIFEPMDVPKGKAIIYIYNHDPDAMSGWDTGSIYVNQMQIIDTLPLGSYFVHVTHPGRHFIHSDSPSVDRPLDLSVGERESVYIYPYRKERIFFGITCFGRKQPQEALEEIKQCRRIQQRF
jgi:hypothetical protein